MLQKSNEHQNIAGHQNNNNNDYIQNQVNSSSVPSKKSTLPVGLNISTSSAERNEVNVEENSADEGGEGQPLRQRRQRTHFTSQQLKVSVIRGYGRSPAPQAF